MSKFNVSQFRQQFAFFTHNPSWVYLDSAATMHKPHAVVEAELAFYQIANSNVHRGAHHLSQQATQLYEQARDTVAGFINAKLRHEVIFTAGTTAALNQLAFGLMHTLLKPGDRILLTALEHHANIVPWQLLRDQIGIEIKVVPVLDDGSLDMAAYAALLTDNVKLVSITHASNVLGTVNDIRAIADLTHTVGALLLVDGCQGAVHCAPDVQALDADFYVFTGHKLFGPTGIGGLYGKRAALEALMNGGVLEIARSDFDVTEDAVVSIFAYLDRIQTRQAGRPGVSGLLALAA